jgi:hypothetical protein
MKKRIVMNAVFMTASCISANTIKKAGAFFVRIACWR